MASPWSFTVQCFVARAAGDQGLPTIRYHALDPQGFLLAAWLVQIGKSADVMHFTVLLRTAAFTRLRQEPLHDFTAMAVHLRQRGCQVKCVTFFTPAPAPQTESQTD